jgi:hypothetical protein
MQGKSCQEDAQSSLPWEQKGLDVEAIDQIVAQQVHRKSPQNSWKHSLCWDSGHSCNAGPVKRTFCSDLSLQTTINPNSDKASLTQPPPKVDLIIKFNNNINTN